jgi:hypothetical protein
MGTKHKSGLHKEISSIFSGVPLPNNNNAASSGPVTNVEPKDNTAGHIPPKPSVPVKPPQISSQEPVKAAVKDKATAAPVNKAGRLNGLRKLVNEFWQKLKGKLLTPQEGVTPARHMAMLILIPALFLVVVFVFGRLLLKSGMRGGNAQDGDMAAVALGPKTQIEWQRPLVYPANLRDPMRKASEQGFSAGTAGDVIVRGIVWSEDSPAAIIGTQIIYQGQTVNDMTIVKISRDSVEFEKDGKRWTQKVSN